MPRQYLIPIALALSPAVFFWPILVGRATFASGDFLLVLYPFHRFVAQEYWQGRFPLWNPYTYGGSPALADPQFAAFYPVSLLTVLIWGRGVLSPLALELEVLAHYALAAIFTYFFVRRLVSGPVPAIAAALVFTYGGYLTSFPPIQLSIIEASVWLPLVLLLLDVAKKKAFYFYPLAGLAAAQAIFAGHPQTLLYIFYASLLYNLWLSLGKRSAKEFARAWAGFLLCWITAAGLASVQILPTLELVLLSGRASLDYAMASTGLEGRELLALLAPKVLGNQGLYVGILSLLLALFGLSLCRIKERSFWLLLSALALLVSFGGATPLFEFVYRFVPGFHYIRQQERALFIFSFSMAILVGFGVQALSQALRRRSNLLVNLVFMVVVVAVVAARRHEFSRLLASEPFLASAFLIAIGGSILLLLAHRGWIGKGVIQGSLLALILLDLHLQSGVYTLPPRSNDPFPILQAVRFIKADPASPYRVSSESLLPGDGNAGIIYGLEDVVGNSPLQLKQSLQLWEKVRDEWVIWQLLNVRYALTLRLMEREGLRLEHQEDGLNLYRLTEPLPRAYLVYKTWQATDEEEVISLLNSERFEPREVAVLSGNKVSLPPVSEVETHSVEVSVLSPTHLNIKARSSADALLVASQTYYPGWRARLDGAECSLLRANLGFTAVFFPAGDHTVDIFYDPLSFRVGLITSSAFFWMLVAYFLWRLRETFLRRRQQDNSGALHAEP